MNRKNPCYDAINKIDCPRRSANCSVTCPEWKKYIEERNENYLKEAIRNVGIKTAGLDDAINNQKRRKIKNTRWKGKHE